MCFSSQWALSSEWVKFHSDPTLGIYVQLQYSPEKNETYLRHDTYQKLMQAAQELKLKHHTLILWDAYRSFDTQNNLWKTHPHSDYVTNPHVEISDHMRGIAVDVCLGDAFGNALDMGTTFDTFSEKSHLRYPRLPTVIKARRRLLKESMSKAGFAPIASEWWHFYDLNWELYSAIHHEQEIPVSDSRN